MASTALRSQVVQNLAQQLLIEPDVGSGLGLAYLERHSGGGPETIDHTLNDRCDLVRASDSAWKARKLKILADNVIQSIQLAKRRSNQAARFAIGIRELVFEQFDIQGNGVQRISDLMGNL